MKIIDYITKYYTDYKKEYEDKEIRLPIAKAELEAVTKKLKEEGYVYGSGYGRDYQKKYIENNSDYYELDNEVKDINKMLPILKSRLIKLNKIINNGEQLISLDRNNLQGWSYDKIILQVGTNAIGNSQSSIDGRLDGNMSGSSFLGIGSMGGSIDGRINSNSKATYEEFVLVKYKYNLDYEIDELIFNINDYLI